MEEESTFGINSGRGESKLRTTFPNLFTTLCKKEMKVQQMSSIRGVSSVRLEI